MVCAYVVLGYHAKPSIMGSLSCISSSEQLAFATQPCARTQCNHVSFLSLFLIATAYCVDTFLLWEEWLHVWAQQFLAVYMYKRTQQEGTKSLVCGPTVYENKPMKQKCKCEKKGGLSRRHVKCVHVKIMLLYLRNTDLRNCTCLKLWVKLLGNISCKCHASSMFTAMSYAAFINSTELKRLAKVYLWVVCLSSL